jgi:uncharacterized protein
VGCGSRAAKSELLRVVAAGDEVIPDPQARKPGRGAYLHPSQECWERAKRRRSIPRALRLPGPLADGGVARYLAAVQDRTGPSGPGNGHSREVVPEKAG